MNVPILRGFRGVNLIEISILFVRIFVYGGMGNMGCGFLEILLSYKIFIFVKVSLKVFLTTFTVIYLGEVD